MKYAVRIVYKAIPFDLRSTEMAEKLVKKIYKQHISSKNNDEGGGKSLTT